MIDIPDEHILLNQSFTDWQEAIHCAGDLMVRRGLVRPKYIDSMIQRQQKVSVYIGNFVALPHGEGDESLILKEGICLLQVPDGVNFGNKKELKIATLLFAVALKGSAQLNMLQELAFFCSDIDNVMALSDGKTLEAVQQILKKE